jgi:prepilin-type N-terminal cleavage/methylation domain-containing protein
MKRKAYQRGVTLIELLLGLAITAILMVPLGAMFQNASSGAVAGQAALNLNGELRFAMDRIARRTPTASIVRDGSGIILQSSVAPPSGTASPPALTYTISGTDLVETENVTIVTSAALGLITISTSAPPRITVIASNAVAFKLSAPATGSQPLLRIDLTLRAPDGTTTSASRTVRFGTAS